MSRVGYVDDPICDKHVGCGPEVPARTATIRKVLTEDDSLLHLPTRKATIHELSLVHSCSYIEKIKQASSLAGEKTSIDFDSDVEINKDTFESACAAAGGVISAVDAVLTKTATHVFCNIRPPGHHASTSKAAGFCIFNNVVIGLEYYLTQRPNDKIAIVDWDVHHGDGTEKILKTKYHPTVSFFSLYNSEIYPGNVGPSDPDKRIENIPLTSSKKYRSYFKKCVLSELKIVKPNLIFISCGFDAHELDPLGGFHLTREDYAWMTKKLLKLTSHIISVLEGGYNLQALKESTQSHLEELKHSCKVANITDNVSNVSI